MADLADLFSADSPPPRSPPPREALFLSPSSTPSHTPAKRRRVEYEPEAEAGTWNDDLGNDLDHGETIEDTLARDYADPDHEAHNAVGREVNRMFAEAQGLSEVGVRALGEILDAPVDEGEEPKPKRLMAKIDADRLLGRWGLPALLDSAKKFKVKGKGHEVSDRGWVGLGMRLGLGGGWADDRRETSGACLMCIRCGRMACFRRGISPTPLGGLRSSAGRRGCRVLSKG